MNRCDKHGHTHPSPIKVLRDRFHDTVPTQRPHVLLAILDQLDATEHETRTHRRDLLDVAPEVS